jgi:hypothetical protein
MHRLPPILTMLGLILMADLALASPVQFFVSPAGSDRNRGTEERPFLTLERARNAVRALRRREGRPAGGVTVWVRGGGYELRDTFALTAQDSGTAEAPVVYRAWPGEAVRLVGGRRVAEWEPVTDPAVLARLPEAARGKVRVADLAALGIADYGRLTSRGFGRPVSPAHLELFYGGQPMTLARWPNQGFVTIAGIPQAHKDEHGGDLGDLKSGFYYEGDRPAGWKNTGDIWVHGYWAWDWANSYERVASLDTATRLIQTAPPYGQYGFRAGQRYYFLNVLEELDSPGEYWVDREAGKVYFWPPLGVASRESRGASGGGEVASGESRVARGEGKEEAWVSLLEEPLVSFTDCSHVALQGLTLECSRGNGVEISGGGQCRLVECTLRNLGNWGVRIAGGVENGLASCDLYQLGDGGVYLEGGDRKSLAAAGHFVDNCDLWEMGRWSKCYQPGVLIHGVGNRVTHCHIHDGPHCGILITGNDHLIEYNELDHLCRETGDVGAFYIGRDWTERGNVVRYNYFHDLASAGHGGSMAVYLDDCASGVMVFGNVFYRTERAAFIGGGRDNVVENNIFVECKPSVQIDGRGLDQSLVWHSMVYQTMKQRLEAMNWTQPPYSTRYPELAALGKYYATDKGIPPEGNVVRRNISVGGPWLEIGWHATLEMVKVEDNLVDVDPRFVDREKGDFRLREDSPAWGLGFQRVPVEEMGRGK